MTNSATSSPQPASLFAGFLATVASMSRDGIPRREDGQPAPLTSTQQGFWFRWMLEPRETPHNVTKAFHLRGEVDRDLLAQSICRIIDRHQAWRTQFITTSEGWPLQHVLPSVSVPLDYLDLRPEPKEPLTVQDARVSAFINAQNQAPFDLGRAPLLRTSLLRLDQFDYLLVLVVHHIVVDGWSIQLFMEELAAIYDALAAGAEPDLPPLPIQFADFARWQRAWMAGPEAQTQAAYWRERLRGFPPLSTLPPDGPRPAVLRNRASHVYTVVDKEQLASLRRFAADQRVTLFMLYLAALGALLYRASGQEDLLIAAPVAGRNQRETLPLLGCFLNTLVLRMDLSGDPSARDLLRRTRATVLEAFARQGLSFPDLVQELRPQRSLNHAPLFQVMLNHKSFSRSTWHMGGVELAETNMKGDGTTLDLIVETADYGPDHCCTISYNSQLYRPDTIGRFRDDFLALLSSIAAAPERRVNELLRQG